MSNERIRALIVEPEPELFAVIKDIFADLPVDCTPAANEINAETKMQEQRPDVILLDLPKIPTLKALKSWRKPDVATNAIPIIVLSTIREETDKADFTTQGATYVVSNFFDINDLYETMKNAIEQIPTQI